MANKELIDFVNNELPSDGEWWCSSNAEPFHKAAGTMMASRISIETIKEILSSLYHAVASEYGN